jgi:hypothetical protein
MPLSNGVLLGCSFLVLLAALVQLAAASGQQDGAINAEIVAKRYSSGFFPVVGSYVEYEIKFTNAGTEAAENQSFWILLTSESNKTHSNGTYAITLIEPNDSRTFHVGPLKMEEEGRHRLLAGMESVAFDYQPDSFTVYRQDVILATFISIPLIIGGAGIIAFSVYRKRKPKRV